MSKTWKYSIFHNSRIETAEQDGDTATIVLENGDKYSADAVIGADGVKSNLRKLFIEDEPVNSAYVAYRGTIPIEEVPEDITLEDVVMWIGPNLHLVQYPVRSGKLFNLVVVFKSYDTSVETGVHQKK